MMKKLTEKQKETILLKNSWEKIVGYDFDYEWDTENMRSIIITKEEIENFLKEEPKVWWWHNAHCAEYAQDLDGAWEYFLDDYCDENNIDDWDEAEKKLLERELMKNE